MVEVRTRQVGRTVLRYGVVYPCVAAAGAYLATDVVEATFETLLFTVFAVVAGVTAAGAMGGSSSNDALQSGAGFTRSSNAGERWDAGALVKLLLVALGLAGLLTAHALWWA